MEKENLFELIRNEEVIIWAGAGMSLNSGYPSGKELCNLLYDNLTDSEKKLFENNYNLLDISEQIFRIKGHNRNYIIKTLKEVFDKEPENIKTHKIISEIPHFRTIITTNYDRLFEIAYKSKGDLILSNSNLAYINKNKTQIFKIHGDLNDPDSIIITHSDYNNFFKSNSEYSTYWSVLKERLSTNSVLFLGYNLEDPNVSVVFERITDNLKSNRKECFLVAPNLPIHKVNDLTLKGIKYIDSTAEKLIEELIQVLKENIVKDLENNKVSANSFKEFVQNFNILPKLDSSKDSFKVEGFKSLNGTPAEGMLNLTLSNDNDFLLEFKDFMQGKSFGEFEISENIIKNAEISFEGIRLSNYTDGVKFNFKSHAAYDDTVNIRFANGEEFFEFPVKLYGNESLIEVHSKLKSCKMIFKINVQNFPSCNFNFKYTREEICLNSRTELEMYNFLRNFAEGHEFTIFLKSGQKISKSLQRFPELIDHSLFYIQYFQKLQIIEKKYNVQFSNFSFNQINQDSIKLVDELIDLIQQGFILYDYKDGLQMELIPDYSQETIEALKGIGENGSPIVGAENNSSNEILHGQTINLGYKKVEILNPIIININDIINRTSNVALAESKTNTMRIKYQDSPFTNEL